MPYVKTTEGRGGRGYVYVRPEDPENIHNVPKRQWRKWRRYQKELFNDTYKAILSMRHVFFHPKTPKMNEEQFEVVAWNAAHTAASVLKV